MKAANPKSLPKTSSLRALKKMIVREKRILKKHSLTKDPFFSSSPVDLGRTNNQIIDQILYGKNGA